MKKNWIMLELVLAAGMLGSCRSASETQLTPVIEKTAVQEQVLPTRAPPTAIQPTATKTATLPAPTATPSPVPSPTAIVAPLTGQVLSPENIQSAELSEITLGGYASEVYWPNAATALVRLENSLQEISLEPLAEAGAAQAIAVPGTLMGIAPDGMKLVYQGGDGGLYLYNRGDGSSQTIPFRGAAYFAFFSPDGKTIAVGAVDKWEVTLYDAASLEAFQTLSGFETAAPVYTAIPGPGQGTLAWYARATLQFQDMASQVLGEPLGNAEFIVSLAFNPGGDLMAVSVGSELEVVPVRASGSPEPRVLWSGNLETVISDCAFSADGRLLAATVGTEVIVWETSGWTQRAALAAGEATLRQVSFSPDGRALVALDDANGLKLWLVP